MASADTKVPMSPNGLRMKGYSPRRNDSPSRQLQFELEKDLAKMQLQDNELQRVHAYHRRLHKELVDAHDLAQEKEHSTGLEAARRKRDELRHQAEITLREHLLEQEKERRRREEQERLKREQEAREKAERERKIREEAERQAKIQRDKAEAEARRVAEERRREEARLAEEAEKRKREQEAKAERERKAAEESAQAKAEQEKSEQARAQKEQEAAKAKALQQSQQAPVATDTSHLPADLATDRALTEKEHKEYLTLYRQIKAFKDNYWEQISKDKVAKKPVGEARRSIRADFQKLNTSDSQGNAAATDRIKQVILVALKSSGPTVPIDDFLPKHLAFNDNGQRKIPASAAYLLAIFAKQTIKACTNEIADTPKLADPTSLTVARIFSMPELQFDREGQTSPTRRVTLFPILLAKFHKVAPGLFGITGDEKTAAGKQRMGWRMERKSEDDPHKTIFVLPETHFSRMKGIAIGYAAIASRNFSKARSMTHPLPPINLWRTVVRIVNMDVAEIQITHICLLKDMFIPEVLRAFLTFFGAVGVAVLREAFVELPRRLPPAVQAHFETKAFMHMVSNTLINEQYFDLT